MFSRRRCGTPDVWLRQAGRRSRSRDERGATAVEYALLVGLISMGIITSTVFLRDKMSLVLKNGVGIVYNFGLSDYSSYHNIPVQRTGYLELKTNQVAAVIHPSGYHTGLGVFSLPEIVKKGALQWAVLACSPNGVGEIRMGVQSGWGNENNLALPIGVNPTYSWQKSAAVTVDPSNARPNVYMWTPTDVVGQEIRMKDHVLGTPAAIDDYISTHEFSGPC